MNPILSLCKNVPHLSVILCDRFIHWKLSLAFSISYLPFPFFFLDIGHIAPLKNSLLSQSPVRTFSVTRMKNQDCSVSYITSANSIILRSKSRESHWWWSLDEKLDPSASCPWALHGTNSVQAEVILTQCALFSNFQSNSRSRKLSTFRTLTL